MNLLPPALGSALVALVVRGIYVFEIHDAPVFELVIGDGKYFLEWSRRIAAGHWIGTETYMVPLYAYFLAAVQAVLGPGLLGIKLVQIVLGSGSCALLAIGAGRLSGPRVAWIAGMLLALHPPAIFADAIVQKSVLDVFLAAALLATLAGLRRDGLVRQAALVGLVLGAFALVRENTMVFVPALLAWALVAFGAARGARVAAAMLVAFVATLVPWTIRNYSVTGELYATTHNFGVNLYLGNRAGASGVYEPLLPGRGNADVEWQDAVSLAEAASGRRLSPAEVSRHWASRGVADILADPAAWVRLLLRKATLLASDVERMDTEDQYTFADASLLLRSLDRVFGFGTLLVLAVFGGAITWRKHPEQRVVWLLAALHLASVLGFYVNGRYRLAGSVLLLYPAALGLDALPSLLRARAFRTLSFGAAAGAVAAALAFLPARNEPLLDMQLMRASTALNVGLQQGRAGDREESERQLRRALALHPRYALAHQSLAQLLLFDGRPAEAEAAYRSALDAEPDYAAALDGLGTLLLRQDRAEEAIPLLARAVALDPGRRDARARLRQAEARAASRGASPAPAAEAEPPSTDAAPAPHDTMRR